LVHDDKVVAVAGFTFCAFDSSEPKWALARYATNMRVVGGLSKLVAAARKVWIGDEPIWSFSDNMTFDGKAYPAAGFAFVADAGLSYTYWWRGRWWHKQNFRLAHIKHRFAEVGKVRPETGTESELAAQLRALPYYDAGKIKWVHRVKP
jgi:hypothetical protein